MAPFTGERAPAGKIVSGETIQASQYPDAEAAKRVDLSGAETHAFQRKRADPAAQPPFMQDYAFGVTPPPRLKRVTPEGGPADIDHVGRKNRSLAARPLDAMTSPHIGQSRTGTKG